MTVQCPVLVQTLVIKSGGIKIVLLESGGEYIECDVRDADLIAIYTYILVITRHRCLIRHVVLSLINPLWMKKRNIIVV